MVKKSKKNVLNNDILLGQAILITGASSEIGRETTIFLASQGANISITGRNYELLLLQTAREIERIGQKCLVLEGDLSSSNDLPARFVNETIRHFSKIDILFNNAGTITRTGFLEMKLSDCNQVIQVNLTAAMLFCQAVIPYIKKRRFGKIINISSHVAKEARLSTAPCYGGSKSGLIYLTRHLAKEFGPYGIYVNSICPDQIKTNMTKHWSEEYKRKIIEQIPIRKLGQPLDIAKAILFLCSEASSFINGGHLM